MSKPAPNGVVIGRYRGTVVVTVHGELDPPRAAHLGQMLGDLIDGQGNLAVVVDLHDAGAADTERVSVLADAAERARRRGTLLTLSRPPPVIDDELRARGLAHLLGT